MRFLSTTLLYGLYASGIVSAGGRRGKKDEDEGEPQPTVFNGVEVPPLPDINGETFNKTIKEGYWFVKHHS